MSRIILASGSPRRKELMKKAGFVFEVIPSQAEEVIIGSDTAQIVQNLAIMKARDIAQTIEGEDTVVIGADTVVAYDGKILGKPLDIQDAIKTLKMLQNDTHQVYTGVCILWHKNGEWKTISFAECTDVTFYPVTDEEIESYVATGEPMDKAGSYGIQGGFGIYVKGICGDYNNVVGFPIARVLQEMKAHSIIQ
ncbi:MAG: Maf family protein [Eubacteriales bacterium]|nr:Maf family protein [Eubacteriales bacterium]